MKRKELYAQIFIEILLNYSTIAPGDIQEQIFDTIELEDLNSAYQDFTTQDPNNLFNNLLIGVINSGEALEDDIPELDIIRFETFTTTQLKNKRDFFLNKPDIIVFNSDKLFTNGSFVFIQNEPSLFRVIEKLCVDISNLRKLLLIVSQLDFNQYILMYSNAYNPNSSWELYSYGLFEFLQSNKIDYALNLNYTLPSPITNTLFNANTEYKQYFDIYDVLNEWQHADEVITSFLKMYHILEYMVYRKGVVEISTGATLKNSFIRQVKSLESKNERLTFIDEFARIFIGIGGQVLRQNIAVDVQAFVGNYFKRSVEFLNSANDKALASFIYDLRCSIVHNKESEFHITYTNQEEYSCLIPIMRDVINIISSKIITILNDPNAVIKFTSPSLTLYYQ
jgi:hypothetical protein